MNNGVFTPRLLALVAFLGITTGIAIRERAPEFLSWRFAAACALAVVLVFAALGRWHYGHERNAFLLFAVLAIAIGLDTGWALSVTAFLAATISLVVFVIDDARSRDDLAVPHPRKSKKTHDHDRDDRGD